MKTIAARCNIHRCMVVVTGAGFNHTGDSMRRYAEEASRIHREWKRMFDNRMESLGAEWYESRPEHHKHLLQKGRFRKKDAFDCGHTQCGMCHRDKFPKRAETLQEKESKLKFRESKDDLN